MQSSNTSNQYSQNPSKMSGQYHSMKGSAVEDAGDMTGSQNLRQAGRAEHARGEEEYNSAQSGGNTGSQNWKQGGGEEYKSTQAKGYGESATDRTGGYTDSASGNARQEKGQTQRETNRPY